MSSAPVLYVLRDLTPATKANARQELQPGRATAEWCLAEGIELETTGRLQLEHALWAVIQEPWIGLDQTSRCLIQQFQKEGALFRFRQELAGLISARASFVALAFPALVDDAVLAGYRIRRIAPTAAQVLAFSSVEQAHHLSCMFPLAPERWGGDSAGGGISQGQGLWRYSPSVLPARPAPAPRAGVRRPGPEAPGHEAPRGRHA
ncbi:MAG: hypothetical protein HGB30_00085 [Holophagaceae bacterium]|nr:hypothetical protein [Holophagaceae bacterium]